MESRFFGTVALSITNIPNEEKHLIAGSVIFCAHTSNNITYGI
jgi:hypothetical protein